MTIYIQDNHPMMYAVLFVFPIRRIAGCTLSTLDLFPIFHMDILVEVYHHVHAPVFLSTSHRICDCVNSNVLLNIQSSNLQFGLLIRVTSSYIPNAPQRDPTPLHSQEGAPTGRGTRHALMAPHQTNTKTSL